MGRLIALLCCLAGPALAETLMDGAAFEAYTKGKTLTFGVPSDPSFGVEQYLPGRRVIWSPMDGTCTHGVWYEDNGHICFLYDHDPIAKCWDIFRTPSGLRAEFVNEPGSSVLFQSPQVQEPLICGDMLS